MTPHTILSAPDLLSQLSALLDKGLAQTAAKITGDISEDFQILGSRMEAIENKLDQTISKTRHKL